MSAAAATAREEKSAVPPEMESAAGAVVDVEKGAAGGKDDAKGCVRMCVCVDWQPDCSG